MSGVYVSFFKQEQSSDDVLKHGLATPEQTLYNYYTKTPGSGGLALVKKPRLGFTP